MKSIFTTFTGLHKNGAPLDLLATWRKTFDKASEKEVSLFRRCTPMVGLPTTRLRCH